MPTIPGLTNATTPLSGDDRLPIDQSGLTRDASLADVAALAEVYAASNLGIRPDRLATGAVHFTTQGAGLQLTSWFPPPLTTAAGYGPVYEVAGGGILWTRGLVSAGPDRVLEVEAEVEQTTVGGGEEPCIRLGLRSLSASYANTDGTPDAWSPLSAPLAETKVLTLRARFGGADRSEVDPWADLAAAVWLRPMVEVNQEADLSGYATGSTARIRRLLVRDVTSHQDLENWLLVAP